MNFKSFSFLLISLLCLNKAIADRPNAVIFLYHHVSEDTPAITSVTPKQFEQQLAYLQANNFQVLPLVDIVNALKSNQPLPDKSVAITFDDAYESIYSEAFPLLKKYQMPFTVFTATESVSKGFNHQLSWQQLKEMAEHGATIANHTYSHLHMLVQNEKENEQQWLARITEEVRQAERDIQAHIGAHPKLFAYPYGEFNDRLAKHIEQLGYIGFGQHSGASGSNSDLRALPRFPIAGNYADISEFATKAKALAMPATVSVQRDNPLPFSAQKPSLILTFDKGFKPGVLNCFGTGQGALQVKQEGQRASVQPKRAIPVGRSRYNCTMSAGSGRFYWLSQPWIRLTENGEWILD